GCRKKAEALGIADNILLCQADVRYFSLPEPAALITFPFRSIGHLLSSEEKVEMLLNVRRNLKPGGKFLFDHYVFDEAWARNHHGLSHLMCRIPGADGTSSLVWDIYHYDFSHQRMQCFIAVETLDTSGTVLNRTYHPLSFSWILPDQMRGLLYEAG